MLQLLSPLVDDRRESSRSHRAGSQRTLDPPSEGMGDVRPGEDETVLGRLEGGGVRREQARGRGAPCAFGPRIGEPVVSIDLQNPCLRDEPTERLFHIRAVDDVQLPLLRRKADDEVALHTRFVGRVVREEDIDRGVMLADSDDLRRQPRDERPELLRGSRLADLRAPVIMPRTLGSS